ncbi:MAG TPA: hypothetical protein VF862_02545, partial [Gemmatimonadales bacterium]
MRTRHLVAALLVSAVVSPNASPAQSGSVITKIFTSDSLAAVDAQTSPDGRWLVLSVMRGPGSSSLFITRTAGGPLIQLTSDGHGDMRARWFASGDRIVFLSDRPNRDGGRQRYLMTLGIDPATGKAVGAPRQVSSEPVVYQGPPSPDGRWLSYVTGLGSAEGQAELKVIPATGGTPRTLAEFGAGTPIFSRDSRYLYFTARERIRGAPCPAQECQFVLKKVSVEGGQAQVLSASAEFPLMVLAGDERFTVQGALRTGVGPVDRVILRTLDGRDVGVIDLPDR